MMPPKRPEKIEGRSVDDFSSAASWLGVASGQAKVKLSSEPGANGLALRLDFDFKGGGGFVGARKEFALRLPEAFAFSFRIRGVAPKNKLEFKLADPGGRNVWRWQEDAFEFRRQPRALFLKSSEIEFAWGPAGGGALRKLGPVEFIISAGPGGKGTVWLEDFRLVNRTIRKTPAVSASSATRGCRPEAVLGPQAANGWRSAPRDSQPWLQLDFRQTREYGGLVIDWEPRPARRAFAVQASDTGRKWRTIHRSHSAEGARGFVYLPKGESRFLRLTFEGAAGVRRLEVQPFGFSRSLVDFMHAVAERCPRGRFPRYLHREQSYWTCAGIPDGLTCALINEEGLVEPDKGTFSLEPFLYTNGKLFAWADARRSVRLEEDGLAIPSARWTLPGVTLETTAFASGHGADAVLFARYRVGNTSRQALRARLFVALRPWQVTPPWQGWKGLGGLSEIKDISWRHGAARVNRNKWVVPLSAPAAFGAAAFEQGAISDHLAHGRVPKQTSAHDDLGLASAAMQFDLRLVGGGSGDVYIAVPFGRDLSRNDAIQTCPHPDPLLSDGRGGTGSRAGNGEPDDERSERVEKWFPLLGERGRVRAVAASTESHRLRMTAKQVRRIARTDGAAKFEEAVRVMRDRLGAVSFHMPAGVAREAARTFRTAAGQILINRDGPALQPGPRRYTRSWIRDGVIMGTALLRVGDRRALPEFIRWFAPFQRKDGFVPCCVDRSGPDWLVEHDSHGQLIYGVMESFRFTRDRAFLKEMWPRVRQAARCLEKLRARRLTPEYKTPEKIACYGLLPESASHEGYLAHPVHSYWDDAWGLRGLMDAAVIAGELGHKRDARAFGKVSASFRQTFQASIRAVIRRKKLHYVPASVEWADFDPTATSNAVNLLPDLAGLPARQLAEMYAQFMRTFRQKHIEKVPWNNYTAYEIRIIGALVRLGKRAEALELLRFFLADRRPRRWNQWPEISWRNPRSPGHLGDVPHTWIAAEYMLAFASLFAYEREADDALILGAGVDEAWVAAPGGISIRGLPTWHGALDLTMKREAGGALRVGLGGALRLPRGGFVVRPPTNQAIRSLTVNGLPAGTFNPREAVIHTLPARAVIAFESGRTELPLGQAARQRRPTVSPDSA